jgi:hypothetical protein
MAGYYQFSFGSTPNSDLTVTYSNDGVNYQTYQEPAWPPNPGNRGSVLQVSPNDTIYIQLVGPSGWQLSGQVQVIASRANSAQSGQRYSPFGADDVWLNPVGSMNGTTWTGTLGDIDDNPGVGNINKYEITVAFNASLPGTNGPSYFSEDPEVDVSGM